MIPGATLIHRLNDRIRIRITGVGKNKVEFFTTLETAFKENFNFQAVLVNPVTGSVVFQDQALDFESIVEYAENEHLFKMKTRQCSGGNQVAESAKKQFKGLNTGFLKLTGNRMDLSSSVFLVLIVHAVREIARGNLTVPSWFTALWLATTIYNRNFFGPVAGDGHDHGDHAGHDGHDGGDSHP